MASSAAESSEDEGKQQCGICCLPDAADLPLRHPLACNDSIGLADVHRALRLFAPSRRHERGEVCDISTRRLRPAPARGPVLPIRGYRLVWAVACLTQLATVQCSFLGGGLLESQIIYSGDSVKEDLYNPSFNISPPTLVEAISTGAERSEEELTARLPSHSTIVRVKATLDIDGVKCFCILTCELQKNVKALEWRTRSLKMVTVHCKGGICLWSASYPGYKISVKSEDFNNMEEQYDDIGAAIRHDQNGRRFGFSLPNTGNRIWSLNTEELGSSNTNNLMDLELEWYFLRDGGNSMEPCLLQGNLTSSRKRMFQPYCRSSGTYQSEYEVHNILSAWGPLVLVEKNSKLYMHNIQSHYVRKVWEPILQVNLVTACSLDYGRIVMTGVKRNLAMQSILDECCLWVCERSLGLDHQWSVTGFDYSGNVISLLAAGSRIYWISDEYELYTIDKDEDDELLIQVYDLADEMTAPAKQMSLLWADGNLLLVELKQVPIVWQVTWDADDTACYHQLTHLMGHNAFVVPGLSGFILPAADGALGNKVYVGNGSSTDCYAYSLTEGIFENLMACESYDLHSACSARWVSLRGAVLEEDYV